ncbi:hypothetical protein Syun_030528 [Stephania yunnanensis]|uniref:Disease resistance R13L4/SHOC-2-like LRR domain-containing protein n=1 Tax=Stephania yunnanensis TaxID=152371 RepID=A0AAP0HFN6_9MAGN
MPNHFPSLQDLNIDEVNNTDMVRSITENITSLTSLSLGGSSSSSSSSEKEEEEVARMLGKNELLVSLAVSGLSLMRYFPDFSGLRFLTSLHISYCEALETCPHPSSSLKDLHISSCPQFQGFLSSNEEQIGSPPPPSPSSSSSSSSSWCVESLSLEDCPSILRLQLHGFTQLQELAIQRCRGLQSLEGLQSLRNIRSLSIGPFSEELDHFPFLDAITGMEMANLISSLRDLSIYGWSRLKSLPEQIQYLSRLEYLYIKDFDGMADLPEWFGKLTSLETLMIWGCKNLMDLPSANEMLKLTSLRRLKIIGCPLLKERCGLGSGSSEWQKISHISEVDVN